MRPLTDSTSKCLLPIAGKAILDHQLDALANQGIEEVFIIHGFFKDQIIEHLAKREYPLRITHISDPAHDKNGPISALYCGAKHLHGELIFFHCDVLFEPQALKELLTHPNETVFLYRKDVWDEEAGKIRVDADSRVLEMGKHIKQEDSSGEYLQIAKFGDAFCKELTAALAVRMEGSRKGYTIDVFNDVAQRIMLPAVAHAFEGTALEIDTKEDYEAAQDYGDPRTEQKSTCSAKVSERVPPVLALVPLAKRPTDMGIYELECRRWKGSVLR